MSIHEVTATLSAKFGILELVGTEGTAVAAVAFTVAVEIASVDLGVFEWVVWQVVTGLKIPQALKETQHSRLCWKLD
jgi:hypothetical protein